MFLLQLFAPAVAGDVDTFHPAASLPNARGSLQGEAPQLGEAGFSGSLSLGHASEPVMRTFTDRPATAEVVGITPVTLHAGYTVEGSARIDLLLPVYAWVDAPLTGYEGLAAGDARLQATLPVVDGEGHVPGFALVPRLHLPTGTADALVAGGVGAQLLASLGADTSDYGWVANLGLTGHRAEQLEAGASALGSTFDGLVSGWWRANEALRVGAELDLALGLVKGEGADQANRTGTAHLFAQDVLPSGVGLTAGAGMGTIAGIGTPQAHGFVAISYARMVRDTDGDGLLDPVDGCPREPEDLDGFQDADGCPEFDNDADGILDVADRCAMIAEDPDGFQDDDGCPDPDNDADGLFDADDRCPNVPGTAELQGCPDTDGDGIGDGEDACPTEAGPKETKGCPDRDGDLVPDFRDACPDEPKPVSEDPATSDGCPKIAFVENGEVKILERVEFDTGKATIKPESDRILKAVVGVLKAHPEVLRVEVQGHTDNVGSAAYNLKLSDQRAQAVRDRLVSEGIPARKLSARGYGEDSPIDSNRTDSGKANNRRVQFVILEAAPPPEQAPAPAPKGPSPEPPPEENPWGETEEQPNPWGNQE